MTRSKTSTVTRPSIETFAFCCDNISLKSSAGRKYTVCELSNYIITILISSPLHKTIEGVGHLRISSSGFRACISAILRMTFDQLPQFALC